MSRRGPADMAAALLADRKNTAGAVTISPKTQGSRFTMTLVNFGGSATAFHGSRRIHAAVE